MLFNSYLFIFGFMSLVLAGYFCIARSSANGAMAWLVAASLVFYGYWNPYSLPVLVGSICANYAAGRCLIDSRIESRRVLLVAAICANLLVLGYFKYMNFFIGNLNAVLPALGTRPLGYINVLLPIGISFFTFTQIAFLIDSYQGKVRETRFINYALFVSFFPHLLSGPVIHHRQVMPQFAKRETFGVNFETIHLGVALFTIGLAKKVLLADSLAGYADVLFNAHVNGIQPGLYLAWIGSFAYTFQIYFDFSGYSDMAVGLGLLFGIYLPINFNSPLRSSSIIEFWQRWHMSLTGYVNEYLYTPLTLKFTRLSFGRPAVVEFVYSLMIPTLTVFLLVGFWHGANWTYVIFGAMHGIFLVVNHLWRKRPFLRRRGTSRSHAGVVAGWVVTFLCIVASLIMFRSDHVRDALAIYRGCLGLNGAGGSVEDAWQGLFSSAHPAAELALLIGVCSFIVLLCPSSASLTPRSKKEVNSQALLRRPAAAIFLGVVFAVSVLHMSKFSPFIYFQF
jgi:alginate O-acetyltransferase complex protein AlgI